MGVSSLTGASSPSLFGPADAARARVIADLRATDQRVRAHEAAHKAVGGDLIRGGASFTYVRGPDGKSYAVAGEVSIDTSPVPGKPAATLAKAQQIQAAALAPADPSAQDRSVAAAAAAMAAQAQRDLQHAQTANQTGQNLDLTA
jgi:hypothetical protein